MPDAPTPRCRNQRPLRCVIMRGGTSKGVFFHEADLPTDPQERDRVLLSVMGSPDPRQIDGLGGADTLTSKIVIIGRSARPDADLDYTFGQIGIELPYVSYSANCGNLSAAVAVFALEEGLIQPTAPVTRVRIYNTNTRQLLVSYVPVDAQGAPANYGDYEIAGVPGKAPEIRLDFAATTGASTGRMLPSGHARDALYVPELGREIDVSFVDVAKVTMFFHARDAGIRGTEGPEEFTPEVLARFWAIRNAGARHIGLPLDSRLPHPVSVLPPMPYTNHMTKAPLTAEEMSFAARRVGGPPPRLHKAFAATGAVCAAVAAHLPGTVVHEVARHFDDGLVRIGHPSGVFPVRVRLGSGGELLEASYSRTARRIMEGTVYMKDPALAC